ncbi:hypothetical protein ACLESD_23430 [Pyxidicoccus sp. 3LFB2]
MAEQFMEQMATHLREVFPEETQPWSEERLLKHVTEAAERASQYGVVLEGDVQRYLECAVLYGWDFDRAPGSAWARAILEDSSLDGVAKMDALEEYQAAQLDGPAEENEERHA